MLLSQNAMKCSLVWEHTRHTPDDLLELVRVCWVYTEVRAMYKASQFGKILLCFFLNVNKNYDIYHNAILHETCLLLLMIKITL